MGQRHGGAPGRGAAAAATTLGVGAGPSSRGVGPSRIAIDQWTRDDEDVALLAGLGQNAHRFSLEWSRTEPGPGCFSWFAKVAANVRPPGATHTSTPT